MQEAPDSTEPGSPQQPAAPPKHLLLCIMAPWIVCVLVALVILKPQEFIPALAGLPIIYVVFGIGVVLVAVDLVYRRLRPAFSPHIGFVLAFFGWAILVTAVKRPDHVADEAMKLAIVTAVFGLIAVGASSRFGLYLFSATFLACALLVSGVALQQGLSPYGCMLAEPEDWDGRGELEYDGRACESVLDCRKDAPVVDGNYRCERVGPWKTASIGGRVRYRGSLADPNELSLMAAMAIPFAMAATERLRRRAAEKHAHDRQRDSDAIARAKRASAMLPLLVTNRLLHRIGEFLRAIPTTVVLSMIGVVVVMSKSRMGVIVYLIVVGLYFIRRVGAWGLVAGCMFGPPMLLFGGRGGEDAESSSEERVGLLYEAFDMIRDTKGIGVGAGQFTDNSAIGLTAHNAYVLACAEAGLVGMFLFCMAVYLAAKVPFALWFGKNRCGPAVSRIAPAMAVSLCGAMVGIFFLSWSYKDILYMMFGASAALYGVARAEDPDVRVGVSAKELFLVAVGMVAALVGLFFITRIKA